VRGICFGFKTKNRAVEARIWRTTCGGAQIRIVGGLLRWGKPGFGSWVRAIKRRAWGRCFGLKHENRAVGARFSRTICGGARIRIVGGLLRWGKPGVRVLGPRNQAARKGEVFWAKTQKPSRGGSDLANDLREGSDSGSGGLIAVG